MNSSAAVSHKSHSSDVSKKWPGCSENPDLPNSKIVLRDSGTKEEAFFDTETWLESDCEDFFSVQGEKTPSLHASPLNRKKSLRELLAESFDRREHIDPPVLADEGHKEEISNPDFKRKSSGSARHCFPGLVRSLSCSEWRKKRLSPVHTAHCQVS